MNYKELFLTASGIIMASSSVFAQAGLPVPPDVAVAVSGGAPRAGIGAHSDVESCWAAWKAAEGLDEGKNDRNGRIILVSHEKASIPEPFNSPNWLAVRKMMIADAEMKARKSLALTMGATIRSDRSESLRMFGGSAAPPSLKPVVEQLSLVDKARALTEKALDAELKKYDPTSAAPGIDRQDRTTQIQLKLDQNIESHAELYAAGAFTAVQCEGPSREEGGKYSVLVGTIWSWKLQAIAESIWNPATSLENTEPSLSLKEQFSTLSADNPDWMALTSGTRVYANEKGEWIVVGFGVAPKTPLMTADKSRASLEALAAIQRFVGEKATVSNRAADRNELRVFTDATSNSFDTSEFYEQIKLVAKDLELKGTAEVASWRGEHPWSKAGMQVVAVAWSPSWAADSKAMGEMLKDAERRMRQQGAVPEVSKHQGQMGTGPAATPARPGAYSSTRGL